MLIYKILLPAEWDEFEAAGGFEGSPFDRDSGFIHCSSREQVADITTRLFGEEPTLVIVALDVDELGTSVLWEEVPGGATFPHVYGKLSLGAVDTVYRVNGATAVDAALPPSVE